MTILSLLSNTPVFLWRNVSPYRKGEDVLIDILILSLVKPAHLDEDSGNLGKRHKMYAEHLGVDEYITKPFRMEALVKSVTELLR